MAGVSLHPIECPSSSYSCEYKVILLKKLRVVINIVIIVLSLCRSVWPSEPYIFLLIFIHADGSRVSIAIIRLRDSVILSRTIKPKQLKLKSHNSAQG